MPLPGFSWNKDTKQVKDAYENSAPDRETEIRRMGGHSGSMESAIAGAPQNTDEIAIPAAKSSARRTKQIPQPAPVPQQSVKSADDLRKEKEVEEAKQKIGENMLREIAGLPYDIWAWMAQDESKGLTPQEEKELGEAYYTVAQSLSFSKISPIWTAILYVGSKNARLVRKRTKLNSEVNELVQDLKGANSKSTRS